MPRQVVAVGDAEFDAVAAAVAAEIHPRIMRQAKPRPDNLSGRRRSVRWRFGSAELPARCAVHACLTRDSRSGLATRTDRLEPHRDCVLRRLLLAVARRRFPRQRRLRLPRAKERELVYRPVRDYVRTPADLGLAHEELWLAVPRARRPGRRARPRLVAAVGARRRADGPLPARRALEPRQQPVPHRPLARARLQRAGDRLSRLRPQRRRAAVRGADPGRRPRRLGRGPPARAARRPAFHLRPLAGRRGGARARGRRATAPPASSPKPASRRCRTSSPSAAFPSARCSTQRFDALDRVRALTHPVAVHPRHRRQRRAVGDERAALRRGPDAEAAAADRRRQPQQLQRHRPDEVPARGRRVRRPRAARRAGPRRAGDDALTRGRRRRRTRSAANEVLRGST